MLNEKPLTKPSSTKTVMIIDDESAARRHLRSVMNKFAELNVIAELSDGKAAVAAIIQQQPDIVFLDIEMPEVNGFDVAQQTQHINYQLVFVTAYDQYALDAFDTNAIDYLLKPVRPSVLEKCINKILHQELLVLEELKKQRQADKLTLSDGNSSRIIEYAHISYIEGIGRYRRIHLSHDGEALHKVNTILSDTTLDEFEAQLVTSEFLRLHRSYIVNMHRVISLTNESRRHFVVLQESGLKIPISRQKLAEVRERLYG